VVRRKTAQPREETQIIRAIWRNVVELQVLNLILVPFMAVAPVVLVALPLVLIAKNPNYSQWSSAMAWQRMGRLKTWRKDHGDSLRTVTRATVWMFFGLFGSFLCEIAFLIAFCFVPWSASGAPRFMLWFGGFPFACYAPLFATWAWRRGHV
jgi:hypothetical protein